MGDLGLPGGSVLKYLPVNAGDTSDSSHKARPLGQEDSPGGEGLATHSRIIAWRIPWTEEPGGHKESDMTEVT